ncbi:Pre-rRNA-processing protein ipi1 [Aspergillus avenaceus]|uniref:Pre-rRNA-processing protein n=1 Tax=Aspergillus avenaceus TaxID=36643 RepID=A0A5N6THH0_ASPAV|nr:Pre-rRNA-processing protein ipi1 [Aspergillus avenaceus]
MGSSSKKKKEKQKDFQKAKLKVGKAKGKPENFTDTSFKTKGITLTQQSLTLNAPTSNSQFSHHLSLLSSKSDSQRRDSLAHLTTSITARPVTSPLPQPVSVILPTLLPLILDANTGVRTQLLKLFRSLPAPDVQDHVLQLLPYIRAGMTHLAADIRVSAVEVLTWLVDVAGPEVVSCAGGWIKTLNCFLSVLGWHTEESAKWSANRASFGKSGSKGTPMMKVLIALGEFLNAGIGAPEPTDVEMGDSEQTPGVSNWEFPVGLAAVHMVPDTASPYAYLNLFGQPRDAEGEMYETWEDRYRVFSTRFMSAVERGVENARKEGGELGRAISGVSKVLKESSAYGRVAV